MNKINHIATCLALLLMFHSFTANCSRHQHALMNSHKAMSIMPQERKALTLHHKGQVQSARTNRKKVLLSGAPAPAPAPCAPAPAPAKCNPAPAPC